MIYVHGESFKWGSGNLWDARILSAFGSVMIVTFNYRLGILGESCNSTCISLHHLVSLGNTQN